jgi:hypothetical protein
MHIRSLSAAWNMHNINPLKTQLNSICHLLALLGAHHILHVSRIRVNALNFWLWGHVKASLYLDTIINLGIQH